MGLGGGLVGDFADALSVEEESLDFGFGALSGDLLAVPEEGDAGGVADAGYDLTAGVDGNDGRGDQGFVGNGLSVGGDGDPGSFSGADDEGEASGCGLDRRLNRQDGMDLAGGALVCRCLVCRCLVCRCLVCLVAPGVVVCFFFLFCLLFLIRFGFFRCARRHKVRFDGLPIQLRG